MPVDVALIDMDGTLCDYDKAMKRDLDKIRGPHDPEFRHGDDLPDWMEARRTLVSSIPGFWSGLDKLELGFEILRCLQNHDYEIHVLSKGPRKKSIAWKEKHEWCLEHLPPSVRICLTEDKSISYGKVLVDDWPEYYLPWLKARPRGVVIVPAQPWNVGAEEHPSGRIYRYDGSNLDRLRAVVRAVKMRPHGEPFVMPP